MPLAANGTYRANYSRSSELDCCKIRSLTSRIVQRLDNHNIPAFYMAETIELELIQPHMAQKPVLRGEIIKNNKRSGCVTIAVAENYRYLSRKY